MKPELTNHIDDWKFNETRNKSFIEKFDIIIVIGIFLIAYFIIF